MSEKRLKIGYEVPSGNKVEIPVWHMLIAGTTQLSGKTTLLKTLAKQAVEKGYKILVFDTKENYADYDGFGVEVPICLRETTDSLTILALLEGIMARKLTPQYATLSRVSEGAKNFQDVLENTEKLIQKSRGFTQDAAIVLRDLMQRLITETKGRETTPELTLGHRINRMTINKFSLEGQQMVIKTAMEDAIHKDKLIVIIDEMSKFMPQRYRSACQKAINHYVTQGAITEDFLWGSTQFLATTSKDAMKAMDVKVLGRQSHDTECQHTLDLIPAIGDKKFTADLIMQLKVGHFVVIAENWVKTIYTCPENAVAAQCIEVARGNREPKDLQYAYLLTAEDVKKLKNLPLTERVALGPETEVVSLETETIVLEDEQPEKPKEERPRPAFTGKPIPFQDSRLGQRFELLENNIEAIRQRVIELENKPVPVAPPPPPPVDLEEIKERLSKLENAPVTEITSLENIKTVVQLREIVRYKTATDTTMRGKILVLAREGFFNAWHPLRDVVKAFQNKPWTAPGLVIRDELQKLSKEAILASKQENREYLYKLAPNVVFETPPEPEAPKNV